MAVIRANIHSLYINSLVVEREAGSVKGGHACG